MEQSYKPSRFILERELTHLSVLISRSPTDHSLITNYENCTKKLEITELATTKGAIVRSRIMDGEGGKKYKILPKAKKSESLRDQEGETRSTGGSIKDNTTPAMLALRPDQVRTT